ncbi:MAG: hypothetical protein J6T65_01260 [Clostridia bacterium]|nr:hypothetical protein [Clostridia bacterium]MBO7397558.1 hypothetical protein [Clostridia bacterium]MBO7657927.1 hypothetical protein [Clostridia bacterium]MBP5665809.1 hypothetical protein [Clostridia bacterium]MBP5766089.1 hypothetical protein [Clostridia bacterium]
MKFSIPRFKLIRSRAVLALAALVAFAAVLLCAGCSGGSGAKYRIPDDLDGGYAATGEKLFDFVCPDETFTAAQGCCFDGRNWVVAFNKFEVSGEECTTLCKFDKNGRFVKQSAVLYLEHANNITYIPEKHAYLVTSCQGTWKECWDGYTLVDRESLEILKKENLGTPFFAMGYCQERKQFASARWDGSTLDFWDRDLVHLSVYAVTPSGTLSQGVFAAPGAVWFVRSSQNGFHQEFLLYDWEGALITSIPLDLENDVESESVNIVGGTVYVTSNGGNRAGLFKVSFEKTGENGG